VIHAPAPATDGRSLDQADADRLYAEAMTAARRVGRLAAELERAALVAAQPGWQISAASCRRAEANLRTSAQAVPDMPPGPSLGVRRSIAIGPLTIDRVRRAAFWDTVLLPLTRREFDLLAALAERPGEVHTKADLLRDVWGYAGRTSRTRTVDSHASRLRRALHAAGAPSATVVNVWGIGYRLCVHEPELAA
jgi:DNA-binding winged helix-turn-helix (wHTH) protein